MKTAPLLPALPHPKRHRRPRLLALSIALALTLPGAQGQTWISGATGNWSDPSRWLGGVPGAQANVDISGSGTVRVDMDARVNVLTLSYDDLPTFLTIAAGRTLTLGDGPMTPYSFDSSYQGWGTLTIGDGPGAGAATLRLTEQYTAPTLFAADIRLSGAGNLIDGQQSGVLLYGQIAGAGEIRNVHLLGQGWVRAQGELRVNGVNFGRDYWNTSPWGVGLEVTEASRAIVQGGDLLMNGRLSGSVYVRAGGTLVLDGPVDTLWGYLNLGSGARVLQADGSSALQSVRVDGTLQLDAGVQQTLGLRQLVGNLLVQGAQTSLTSTINSFADGVQRGNITLDGGSFAYNGAPLHTNTGRIELRDNARFLAAGGVPALRGLQVNEGTLILSNTREQIDNFDQRGTLLLRNGARLDVTGVLANVEAGGMLSGSFDLDASTLTYAYAREDTIPLDGSDPVSSGVFSPVSVNSGVLKLRNGAQILAQGRDALRSLRTNSAGALLQLSGSQQLQLDAGLTNFGSIALNDDAALRVTGDLENFQSLALQARSRLVLTGRLYNHKDVVIQTYQDVNLPGGVYNRGSFSLSVRQAELGSFENLGSATLRAVGSTGHMSQLINRGELSFTEGSWTADQARLVPKAAGESGRLTIARTASLQMPADGLMDAGSLGRAGQVITIDGTLATPAFADRSFDQRADLTVRGSFTQGGANWLNLLAQNFGSLRAYGQQVNTTDLGTINLGLLELREGSHWRTRSLRNYPEGTLLIDPTSRLTLTTTSGGAGLAGNTRILGTLDLGGAGMSFNGGTHEVRGRILVNGEGSGNGLDVMRFNLGTLQLYGQQVQARNVTTFQPWVNTGRLELREGTSLTAASFQNSGSLFIDATSQATLGAAAFSARATVENNGVLRLRNNGVDEQGHWWQRYTGGAQSSLFVEAGTLLDIASGFTQAGALSGREFSLLGNVSVPESIVSVAPGSRLVGGPNLRVAGTGRAALLDLANVRGDVEIRNLSGETSLSQELGISGRLSFVGSSLHYSPLVRVPGYGYAPRQVINDGVLEVRGNSRILFSGLNNSGRVFVEAGSTLDAFHAWAPDIGLPGANLSRGQWQVSGTLKLGGGRQSVLPGAASYEYIGAGARIYTEEFSPSGLFTYGLFDDVLSRVDGQLTLSGHSLNASASQGFTNTGTVLLRQQATLATRGLRQQGQLQVQAGSALDTRLGAADAGQDVLQDVASARTRLDGTLHTASFQLLAGQLSGSGVLDGNLVMGSAGLMQLEVRSWTDYDHLSVLGSLRAGGVVQIDLAAGLTDGGTDLPLLTWANVKSSFGQVQLSASGWQTELRSDGLYLVSSVPEPATWLALLAGLGVIGLRRAAARRD